jgi:hypothetical protein
LLHRTSTIKTQWSKSFVSLYMEQGPATIVINSIPVPARIGRVSRSTLLTGTDWPQSRTGLRTGWSRAFRVVLRPEFVVSCISVPVLGVPFAVIAGYVRVCLACAPVVFGAKVGHASSRSSIYRNCPYTRWWRDGLMENKLFFSIN